MGEEERVLRWGGRAGILGGIVFLLSIVILSAAGPLEPADPEGQVIRFPEVRVLLTLGQSLFLVFYILWAVLLLALYRALRETQIAPALFGTVLAVMGLAVLTISAVPAVAFAPISDLYHASGATPEEQATLVLVWQAIQGLFNLLDAIGLFVVAIGLILIGVTMGRAPAFGKGFGWASIALGVVGVTAASLFVANPTFVIALAGALPIFAVFPLLFGWKVYRLSRAG